MTATRALSVVALIAATLGLSACGESGPTAEESRYLAAVSTLDLSDEAALQAARDYCGAWRGEDLDVVARDAISYLPTGYKAVVAAAAQEHICK